MPQRLIVNIEKSNREKHNDQNRLASVFIEVLKSMFINLTKSELLKRCLQGLTQNQNEPINELLWSKCSKKKICGKVNVLFSVSETIVILIQDQVPK